MTSNLFGRTLGSISPQALQRAETSKLLHALQAAPGIRFESGTQSKDGVERHSNKGAQDGPVETVWAHRAGVNCLTIDRFEGRWLLSGGADSSIHLWDHESASNTLNRCIYHPTAKTTTSHKYGITHLSFYPFDSKAFLSTSYDHTLQISATETLHPSASFDLDSVIYSHALSPIADHLLVACATQHPAIRLVDLRSGAKTHSLAGHQGAVLSVAWSPIDEHILASGGSDGTARLWDVRRSAGSLGVLDLDDSIGVGGEDGMGKKARSRWSGKAHVGACNGVVWTDKGVLVTAGHDERVRVWDVHLGANALSHFGPIIKNTHMSTLLPLMVPGNVGRPGDQVMLYPNEKEILMFDLFEGTLLKRLKVQGAVVAQAGGGGVRGVKSRVTGLAWRAGDVEVYSGHSDGVVRAWRPRSKAEVEVEREEMEGEVDGAGKDEERTRKRKALDDVFRSLTRQKITFT